MSNANFIDSGNSSGNSMACNDLRPTQESRSFEEVHYDAPMRRLKPTSALALLAVSLLLVGYVLSVGPASRIEVATPIPIEVWEVLYWPLLRATERSATFDRALDRYLKMWGVGLVRLDDRILPVWRREPSTQG